MLEKVLLRLESTPEASAADRDALIQALAGATNAPTLGKCRPEQLTSLRARVRRHFEAQPKLVGFEHVLLDFAFAMEWHRREQFEKCVEIITDSLDSATHYRSQRGELLAAALIKLRRWRDALDSLAETEKFAKDPYAHLEIARYRGIAYGEAGEYSKALSAAREIESLAAKHAELEVISLEYLTKIYRLSRKTRKAFDRVKRWHAALPKSDRAARARAAFERGMIEFAIERATPQGRNATKYLTIAVDSGVLDRRTHGEALLKLVEVLAWHERNSEAFDRVRQFRSEAPDNLTNQLEALVLEGRLESLHGADETTLERITTQAVRALEPRIEQWKQRGGEAGGSGFLSLDDERAMIGELLELVLATQTPEAALQILLDVQRSNSIAIARDVGPCSVEQVQTDLLGNDHAMLVYLPWKRMTHAFLATADTVTVRRLAPRSQIDAHEFVHELILPPWIAKSTPGHAERLDRSSTKLRQVLLDETMERFVLEHRKLTLVGSGMLYRTPFECLKLTDGRLLGEAVAINNVSSIPLALHLRKSFEKPNGEATASLLACTLTKAIEANGKLKSQPFPRGEVAAIESRYGSTETLFDEDCLVATVARMGIASADVNHVFAHFYKAPDDELTIGLVLHDGVLGYEDVERMRSRGLCILSSCSAGQSSIKLGDDALATNLGGALLRGGAHSVVLSRTAVELYAHLPFANRLHEGLSAGQDIAEAMRIARAAETDTLARYWAGLFQLSGLGHVPMSGK